jgi:hypothetical protein
MGVKSGKGMAEMTGNAINDYKIGQNLGVYDGQRYRQ